MLMTINTKCEIVLVVSSKTFEKLQGKTGRIKLIKTEKVGNNICIFNDEIYWYGDLNFGDIVKPYMTAVRIYSHNLIETTKSNQRQLSKNIGSNLR